MAEPDPTLHVVGQALLDVREANCSTHGEERELLLHRLRVMGYEVVPAAVHPTDWLDVPLHRHAIRSQEATDGRQEQEDGPDV